MANRFNYDKTKNYDMEVQAFTIKSDDITVQIMVVRRR